LFEGMGAFHPFFLASLGFEHENLSLPYTLNKHEKYTCITQTKTLPLRFANGKNWKKVIYSEVFVHDFV